MRGNMRLEGNFYNIHSITPSDNGCYVVRVELAAEHPIYAGHFPEMAVVPGVCTLTIIRECLAHIVGHAVTFTTIKECKYVAVLLPHEGLTITLDLKLNDTQLIASVTRDEDSATVLKLKATI